MVPEKPELPPEMAVMVPSGEVTEDCKFAVKVLPPELVKVTAPGPKEFAVPLAKLLGLPLILQVTVSALEPVDAVTEGLLQLTTVCTGTTSVMVALALPLSALAVVITGSNPATAREIRTHFAVCMV